MSGTMVYNGTL